MTVTSLDTRRRLRDAKLRGPEPVNPFTSLREAKGLTLGELSAYSGIDHRALSRAEDGMYTRPLPALMTYWLRNNLDTSEGALLSAYEDFIDAQRSRHKYYFGPDLMFVRADLMQHPFRQLRANRPSLATGRPLPVGLVECCRALCLPLDSIQFFEKKYRSQKSVPKTLINALNQIGYNRSNIEHFEQTYAEWRERCKNGGLKFS